MTISSAHDQTGSPTPETESLAEQLRHKNVQPIRSADDLACEGLFDDDELDEFLAYTYTARRAELA